MKRSRRVKVLATLGPSSSDYATIRQLCEQGADAFRLNMSHGNHTDHEARYDIIRKIETDLGRPIAILADLQGPKLRIGVFGDGPIQLAMGDQFLLDLDPTPGDQKRVTLPHPEIFQALEVDTHLLLNDGKIQLRVIEISPEHALTEVLVGGELSERKGVNVPDVELPLTALTDKDRADLAFACDLGVDWIALSFVQRAQDVIEANNLINGRAATLVKIEKPAAMKNIDAILQETDAVMVARGDLGVELPAAQVPLAQKTLVRKSRARGLPVVVATQMLESMITAPVPTRAEVSDVSNAILEGADAIMLSAESAAGEYPIEAVAMMNTIAETIEDSSEYRQQIESSRISLRGSTADAIVAAAREVSETDFISGICCFTHSGTTALRAARERPFVPILALSPVERTCRRLALVWGLHAVLCTDASRFRECVYQAVSISRRENIANNGEKIIITAGVPFGSPGSTNILRIAEVADLPVTH